MTAATAGATAGEEFHDQARRRLAPEVVRRLSRLSPWRSLFAVGGTWALIAAFATAALLWPHPLVLVAAILGIATQQHALAVLAHEATHYRLLPSRRLNDLAGQLCGAAVGISMFTYRVVHRLHHNHLYQPSDPDMALQAGYPRGRAYLLKRLAKDLAGLTTVKNYRYFFGLPGANAETGKGQRPVDDTAPALSRAAVRDQRLVIAVHLASLPVLAVTGWWDEYLLLWILPLVTIVQLMLRFRAVAEHGAVPDTGDVRRASRTNMAPFYVRWFLFPHHVNYHIEHHLYPSIPHYRLPACHRALAQAGVLAGAEVVPFRETLGKLFAERAAA